MPENTNFSYTMPTFNEAGALSGSDNAGYGMQDVWSAYQTSINIAGVLEDEAGKEFGAALEPYDPTQENLLRDSYAESVKQFRAGAKESRLSALQGLRETTSAVGKTGLAGGGSARDAASKSLMEYAEGGVKAREGLKKEFGSVKDQIRAKREAYMDQIIGLTTSIPAEDTDAYPQITDMLDAQGGLTPGEDVNLSDPTTW